MKRIDILPDDVLLDMFDAYMDMSRLHSRFKAGVEAWQSLVHVCRRWRRLVLGSPRRLNLQLFCTPKTRARDTLDVWPAFPLIIQGDTALTPNVDVDNIIAALGQSNRVCEISLSLAGWQLEKVLAAMHVPFPELIELRLFPDAEALPVVPDSFLDRSAPRLRIFHLDAIPIPGLPKLLLSATHLVELLLTNIPHSGYIPPEAIVALLSVLSSLRTLNLGFHSPQSRPGWETRRPPPSKRSVVPDLTSLSFKGAIEYLEDLVTFIDAPQLEILYIAFFNQIDFDIPRLTQFINRTPRLRKPDAHVQFGDRFAHVVLPPATPGSSGFGISISCREPDWQLSSLAQICNSSLHPLSTAEDLYIEHQYSQLVWKNDANHAIENTLWLELLLPFAAVANLYLSKEFAPGIAFALQELVGGRIREVLPNLQNIFVEGLESSGPFQENIGQFVSARQLSNHPIAISVWDKQPNMGPM